VDNVNCDVWIGKNNLRGIPVVIEWHFMADGWLDEQTKKEKKNTLIYIRINSYNSDNPDQVSTKINTKEVTQT
jgi:hypothetical protein